MIDHVRRDVLPALMLDTQVPSTIDATVKDGVVTLTGTADWQDQRDEAAFVAGNVREVFGVVNQVVLTTPWEAPAVTAPRPSHRLVLSAATRTLFTLGGWRHRLRRGSGGP